MTATQRGSMQADQPQHQYVPDTLVQDVRATSAQRRARALRSYLLSRDIAGTFDATLLTPSLTTRKSRKLKHALADVAGAGVRALLSKSAQNTSCTKE